MINEYSKALFELTNSNNLDNIKESFDAFIECYEEDFEKILLSPRISKLEKKDMIQKCFKSCNVDFVYFLLVILDNNRFEMIREIYKDFIELINEQDKIVNIDIHTSSDLDNNAKDIIIKSLQTKFDDKKIVLNIFINKELLGGLKIYHKGVLIDATIKSQLELLKMNL